MRNQLRKVLAIVVMAAMAFCAPGSSAGLAGRSPGRSARQDRCLDGVYVATIAGFYRGKGEAEVRPDAVRIKITVRTEDGRAGRLDALLPASGPYFGGQATVINQPITIRGRLDAARASRLVATIMGADGHGGRIIGILPSDAGDAGWDQGD